MRIREVLISETIARKIWQKHKVLPEAKTFSSATHWYVEPGTADTWPLDWQAEGT